MDKEKESTPKVGEQQEDPILIALRHRWVELPCGLSVPEEYLVQSSN